MISPEHFCHKIVLRIQKLRTGQFLTPEIDYVALLAVYVVLKMEFTTNASSHPLADPKDKSVVVEEVKDMFAAQGYTDSNLARAFEIIESEPDILADVSWLFRSVECSSPAFFFQKCADCLTSQTVRKRYFPPSKEVFGMMNNLNPVVSSEFILGINFNLPDCTESEITSGSLQRDAATYNICFEPFLHFVNELKSCLISDRRVNNFLVPVNGAYIEGMPEFDLVIANPPFGANSLDDSGVINLSGEAQFLRKAIDATARKGKIVFIVPLGFLFKGSASSAEYQLREELTDSRAIKCIIELPDSVFMPNAKIRTAILSIDYSKPSDFIIMTRFSNEQLGSLKDIDATEIHRLVYGEQVSICMEKQPAVCRVPYSLVIENGYDWQMQTYNGTNPHSFRAIDEIRKEVINLENQLEEVRRNINDTLQNMRSFL